MAANESRQTRSEQREATREKARAMREANARKERNKSAALRVSLVVGILAVIGLIAAAIIGGISQQAATATGPANMLYDNGIKIGANLEAFTKTQTPAPTPAPLQALPFQTFRFTWTTSAQSVKASSRATRISCASGLRQVWQPSSSTQFRS